MLFTLLLAVIPSLVLAFFVYKKDILEKEPIGLLLRLFISGVLLTIPVAFLENLLMSIIPLDKNSLLYTFILAFLIVAVTEEGFKAIIAYKATWNNKNFNHIYDGIVYCVFTSLGFATLENILYVTSYGNATGILRALVSVPAHAFFGVTMGYYMGLAKLYQCFHQESKKTSHSILSIFLPILFHGIFDFLLLTNNDFMIIIFFIFVLVLYVISYRKIKRLSKVTTMLPN